MRPLRRPAHPLPIRGAQVPTTRRSDSGCITVIPDRTRKSRVGGSWEEEELKLGPILGPFLGARLLRDELRVATAKREYALPRIADWVCYGGLFYGDVEIIADEQIGNGRARRMKPFDAALAAIPSERS